MNRIFYYIENGKGNGLLFLLFGAVVLASFAIFPLRLSIKKDYALLQPQLSLAADSILPVTVESGKIIDPIDVYKKFDLNFGSGKNEEEIFSIIFDTREDASLKKVDNVWFFITTDMIYLPMLDKKITFQDGVLDKAKFLDMLQSFNYIFPLIFFISIIAFSGILFGVFLVECLLLAWCTKGLLKAIKKIDADFSKLMRLSAIVLVFVEIILLAISLYFNVSIVIFQRLIIELLCVWFFASKNEDIFK